MSQRVRFVLLIIVQAIVFGWMTRTQEFSAVIVLGALIGLPRRFQVQLEDRRRFLVAAVLAVLMIIKYRVAPYEMGLTLTALLFPLAHVIGQYFLILQTLCLFHKFPDDRLPNWPVAAGAIVLICAGDVYPRGEQRDVYLGGVVAYGAVAALFLSARRLRTYPGLIAGSRGRAALSALVLLGMAGGTWASVTVTEHYHRRLENWFIQQFYADYDSDQLGFSGRARLGNVAQRQGKGKETIALRVAADSQPGYMRGRAFDVYEPRDGSWSVYHPREQEVSGDVGPSGRQAQLRERGHAVTLSPAPKSAFAADRTNYQVFPIQGISDAPSERLECWPLVPTFGSLFTTLDTRQVAASVATVRVNRHDIVMHAEPDENVPYMLDRGRSGGGLLMRPTSPEVKASLLQVPESLANHPGIRQLARLLFQNCRTTDDKLAAVTAFFHEHYKYRLGIEVPPGEEPLTYFLLKRPPAHCEYFASGAVMLLRMGGVPCRYVTGYVVAERSRINGDWIARNQHAHAWVEAYRPGKGWTTIEPTPSDGVPEPAEQKRTTEFWEYVRDGLKKLQAELSVGGIPRLFEIVVDWLQTRLACVLYGLAFVVLGIRWFLRQRARRNSRDVDASPEVRALRTLLQRVERGLRRRGYERQPAETLLQFSARLRESRTKDFDCTAFAEWLENYSAARFGMDIDSSVVERLKAELPTRQPAERAS